MAQLPSVTSRRFRIESRLGSGGMGDVFRAFDTERGQAVALKTLRQVHPKAILQFKSEFRTLADIAHPNLVALYDLVSEGSEWFFTMELLAQTDFLSYVRGKEVREDGGRASFVRGPDGETEDDAEEDDSPTEAGPAPSSPVEVSGRRSRWPLRESAPPAAPAQNAGPPRLDRLRPALKQLAAGLHALHATGHLHRDVKPSNVLVTDEGRVVLVDFGIIAEVGTRAGDPNLEIAGTPAFMAPEQFDAKARPTPASDWYSLGILLFAALAGYVPFRGGFATLMRAKMQGTLPDFDTVFEDVRRDSPELVLLCRDLLHADPEKRPTGDEILARLGGAPVSATLEVDDGRGTTVALVGRDAELATLDHALDEATRSHGGAVLVRGVSGMGKSALVDTFLARAEARGDVAVIAGRCYESESVPYKTLDSLIDSLYRTLRAGHLRLDAAAMPNDATALALVFPVLQQLPAFAEAIGAAGASTKAEELQRRAFQALLDFFGRLSKHRTLILYVDDLQWGDTDSLPVVFDLLKKTGRRVLFLGAYRLEEEDKSPVITSIVQRMQAGGTVDPVVVTVRELSDRALRDLVQETLGEQGGRELVSRIARDSRGHPYLAHELARYAMTEGGLTAEMTLEAVIRARTALLSREALALLQVIAVAGRPITNLVAQAACEVTTEQRRAFAELRAGRFIRTSGSRATDSVEPYHDRIRETVAVDLPPPAAKGIHLRIAKAIENTTAPSDQRTYELAHHYFVAAADGEERRTFELNLEAAAVAHRHNAFAQAYEYAGHAKKVAQAVGIALPGSFHLLFADAAGRIAREDEALLAYERGLVVSTDKRERARIRLGMARLAMGQLDMKKARVAATKALEEMGDTSPETGVLGMLRSGGELLSGLRGLSDPKVFGKATGEALVDTRELVTIHDLIGYICYFEMDNARMLQCLARNARYVAEIGPSFELSNWHSLAGLTSAVLGRQSWAVKNAQRSLEIASMIHDPVAKAYAYGYAAHALNIAGHPLEAERSLLDCLNGSGFLLPNLNYLSAVADYAWVTMTRGYAKRAKEYIDLAVARVRSGTRSALAEGHTYRCYAAPVLALLGQGDAGAEVLREFGEFLASTPFEAWRSASYQSHRVLYAALTGDDALFEDAARAHAELGLSPRKTRLQLRHAYLGIALGRIRQLEKAPASERSVAEKRARAALADLETVSGHPTLRAHLKVLWARMRRILAGPEGGAFERLLAEASTLADEYDNPWVRGEVAMERALAHRAAGREAEAMRELDRAAELAEEHGLGRMKREALRLRGS